MKIVVTGGAGFLGYHISQKINRITEFKDCTFFDIAEFEKDEYDPAINCIYGDVRDKVRMDEKERHFRDKRRWYKECYGKCSQE